MATTNPIATGILVDPRRSSITVNPDGTAGNGAIGSVALFTVTGTVQIHSIAATCITTLTGATATLALGVTGATALFIAATTATTITSTNLLWVSTSPSAGGIAIPAACKDIAIAANVIATVATAAVSGGSIRFDVVWRPLSPDGNLA